MAEHIDSENRVPQNGKPLWLAGQLRDVPLQGTPLRRTT
jgi:hypothetical protein